MLWQKNKSCQASSQCSNRWGFFHLYTTLVFEFICQELLELLECKHPTKYIYAHGKVLACGL